MIGLFKRAWGAFDDRVGVSSTFMPLLEHPIPKGTGWAYVIGSATLFAFITAVVSGIPLAAMYSSAAGSAYDSIQWITRVAPLGSLIRGIHFYAGTAMLLLVGAHALQTFLYGAYKYPREVNWMAGVILLFTTAGIMFTGQVLRWDQYGVWTVAILDYQLDRVPVIGHVLAYIFLGGYTFNGATLSRFFALHVFVLPGALFAIIGFHLYLVIHNGISEPPRAGRPVDPRTYKAWYKELLKRHGEPFFPDAAWRDVIAATVVLSAIVLFAAIVGPPALVGPPDPSNVAVQPRPDWYFLWYYAALALIPDASEPYVMILGPLIAIVGLIALPIIANKGERSFKRRPVAVAASVGVVVFIVAMTQAGAQAGWSPRFDQAPALSAQEITATSAVKPTAAIYRGAQIWHAHGCEYCHMIGGKGGIRGPDLTYVGNRLTTTTITVRILAGATPYMPAYGGLLSSGQVSDLVAFLSTRGTHGQDQQFERPAITSAGRPKH